MEDIFKFKVFLLYYSIFFLFGVCILLLLDNFYCDLCFISLLEIFLEVY